MNIATKQRHGWLAAGLSVVILGGVIAQTPPAAALMKSGQSSVQRYVSRGRQYVRHWRSGHGWSRWRSTRIASRRKRRTTVAYRRPVPRVGRAASIIEPPPVRVMTTVSMTGSMARATSLSRVRAFPISGPAISGIVLDGQDQAGRVSLVTDDGRFITARLNEATNVSGDKSARLPSHVREGMRVTLKGSWQPGDAAGYNAAVVSVRGRVSETAVQARVSDACRKLAVTRTPEPTPEPTPSPAGETGTEKPGEEQTSKPGDAAPAMPQKPEANPSSTPVPEPVVLPVVGS